MHSIITKTLIASAVVISSNAALAAEPQFYIEGNVGQADIGSVKTSRYTGSVNGYTWDASASIDYNKPTYWGFEIGANKPGDLPLRLGFAYTTMKAKFRQASLTGSVSDGNTTYSGSVPITRADLGDLGLDFDNRINIYNINAYYDFDTKSAVRPYIGFGLGFADIENAEDNEFTYSLHAGLNYDISKSTYIGARVGWYRISGPTDKLGIAYDDITTTTYGVTVGYRY
jgi:opacity protein-like surface antigen